MEKKSVFTVAGISVIASSAVTILDFIEKRKKMSVGMGKLVAGAIGVLIGMALAYEPRRQEKLPVDKSELFEEEDADSAKQSIHEVLRDSAAHGSVPAAMAPRAIEVDSETSIEDFLTEK